MNKLTRVLVYPCNSENAQEIHRSLNSCVNVEIFGVSNKDCHAELSFTNYYKCLPSFKDGEFLKKLNNFLSEHQIDFVFPTHDDLVLFLSKNTCEVKAEIICSPYETAVLCRNKALFYEEIRCLPFCPTVYVSARDLTEDVFLKPVAGQGGQGTAHLALKEVQEKHFSEEFIVMEYLPYDEYTIDCFTDKTGTLLFHGARKRKRTLGGICVRSEIVAIEELSLIAHELNTRIKFRGPWFFQAKYDKNWNPKVLEISSRVAGSMNTYRPRGINFSLLALNDWSNNALSIIDNGLDYEVDRTLHSRYLVDFFYTTVYIDLDDTIVVKGKINLNAIVYLYQCQNQGKDVYLLTRHNEIDLEDYLEEMRISASIFKDVLFVPEQEHKYTYIKVSRAVFIDNSFQERLEAHQHTDCVVFDVDGIELLIDTKL